MLVPLVGFVLGCAVFICVGMALLALLPKLRLTMPNLVVFVIAAVPASAGGAIAYGWAFGDAAGQLTPVAVIGLYAVLLIAGMCGGIVAVFFCRWLVRAIRPQTEFGGPPPN